MTKRPFRKLKGVTKQNDEYAMSTNRRPYVFNFVTKDGGSVESQGNIPIECVDRLVEILRELTEMHTA